MSHLTEPHQKVHLVEYLKTIVDKRKDRGKRHQLLPTLIIMIMAMLSGYTGLRAIARFAKANREVLKDYLPLPRGKTPSFPTRYRISKASDCAQVIEAVNDWMSQYLKGERIAIDGKSINSTVSASQESEQNLVSLVSLFSQSSHLILKVGQLENNKGSEINKVSELLEQLEINQAVFTLDALHCQKKRSKPLLIKAMVTSLP